MNQSKHTPGPFVIRKRECELGCCDDIREIIAIYPGDKEFNRLVATVDGGNAVWLKEGEAEANASLFAAAPDLLAACKAVVEEDGFVGSALMRKRIEQMKAAIAKAEVDT